MRFFFYGTLMEQAATPIAMLLHARLLPGVRATVKGTLHAIPDPEGWYPALTPGEGAVRGMVHETAEDFSPEDLARLDAYEDFSPADPSASLYVRRPIAASIGVVEAYQFNRRLPAGALAIAGGDFHAWLAERGFGAFGGSLAE